mmetsp:Transcript_10152/g.23954  ORF Transcript_10152/g.23954 Transcript_10152/m.23954 type:complete len:229 (-) Transcript_10152:127-813(-)
MLGLVNGQRLSKCSRCTLGCRVRDGLCLTECTNETAHVDDIALGLSQMRQCLLADGEVAYEIELEKVLHVGHREVIDGARRRMPSGIINHTVQSAKFLDRLSDYIDALVDVGDVGLHKERPARVTVVGVELGLQLLAVVQLLVAKNNIGTSRHEDTDTTLAYAHGPSRNDNYLINVSACQPDGEGLNLGRHGEIRSSRGLACGDIFLAEIVGQDDARRRLHGPSGTNC